MTDMLPCIPFRCPNLLDAQRTKARIDELCVVVTRGDYTVLLQHQDGIQWYCLVYAGNIAGMVNDLRDERFL